jgi:hypothetical protein
MYAYCGIVRKASDSPDKDFCISICLCHVLCSRRRSYQGNDYNYRRLISSSNPAQQDIVASRHKFPKPIERYGALSFFGKNIVVSEFDEWKKYRKVCSPAFNEV